MVVAGTTTAETSAIAQQRVEVVATVGPVSVQGANHSLRKDYRAPLVPLARDSQQPQLHLPAAALNHRSELVVCGAYRFCLVHPVGSMAARGPYWPPTPEGSGAKTADPEARRCSARVPARGFLVLGQRRPEMAGQCLLDGDVVLLQRDDGEGYRQPRIAAEMANGSQSLEQATQREHRISLGVSRERAGKQALA